MLKRANLLAMLMSGCALQMALLGSLWAMPQQQAPPAKPPAAQSGGVAASEVRYRVLRSLSGPKGTVQGGRFIMEDPRTVFYIPEDKQVTVYFDWEGPTGHHQFEALWRNPAGKVTVISNFAYEAHNRRFGGYWTLLLNESTETGLWTLEARIDGEAAGSYSFQILATLRPPGSEGPPPRIPLAHAEIYKRAVSASVSVEAMDENGEKFNVGQGFFLGDGAIVTAFEVIDGAHKLRMVLSDGRVFETDSVLASNRWQDWAVLAAAPDPPLKLARAPAAPAVGDRVYAVDVASVGSRTILDLDVVGNNKFGRAGERLNITNSVSPAGMGGPLLNEYGEVLGLMGGSLVPGAGWTSAQFNYINLSLYSAIRGGLAVPISLVSLQGSKPATLAELHQAGMMIQRLKPGDGTYYGNLNRAAAGSVAGPIDNKNEFRAREKQCAVRLIVRSGEKSKSTVTLRIFDADNQQLAESAPLKANFRPDESRIFDWKFQIANLPPGFYRVDAYVDVNPVWRTFFRITE